MPGTQAQSERSDSGARRMYRIWQARWNRAIPISAFVVSALFFLTSLVAYFTDYAYHADVLSWYDLNVYNDAGLLTRQLPQLLYTWQLTPSVKFTYTPFAAILFAGGSHISWPTLTWIMTIASIVAVLASAWLTVGAMGRRGLSRASIALTVSALALWIEPVTKGLYLGQIEPLLLLLVVWDLTRRDSSWWKGTAIGIAAGIKLVPLLFIPFLLVAGKIRQAVIATASFAATIVIGFIVLPGPSASYWLTGYFIKPGRTGGVDSLVNQSLLAVIARLMGGVRQGQATWLAVAVVVGLVGIGVGAILVRSGHQVEGWVLVGITSVLVSPISWDHHWVWIVAVLAMLGGLAANSRRGRFWIYAVLIVATSAVYGSWPWTYSGPEAFVPKRGLLGWFVTKPKGVTDLHGWQILTWNLYAAGGCVIFIVMVIAAIVAWRRRPPQERPATPAQTTTDALLARADMVLKGNATLGPVPARPPGAP